MNSSQLTASILALCPLILATACVTMEFPVTETYYETQYKTEYKTETYTETANVAVSTKKSMKYLNPVVQWHDKLASPEMPDTYSTYYYGYSLYDWDFDPSAHHKTQVKVAVSGLAQQQKGTIRIYDVTGVGQIPPMPTPIGYDFGYFYAAWFNTVLIPKLNAARVIGELHTSVGQQDYFIFDAKGMTDFAILVTSYTYYTIASVQLTWSDDIIEQQTVTRQRQVPTQVPVQVPKQRTVIKTEQVPFWEAVFGR